MSNKRLRGKYTPDRKKPVLRSKNSKIIKSKDGSSKK